MELPEEQRPQWLKDEIFREVLETTLDSEVQLYDVTVENASHKGETSQSNIFRVTVKYTQGAALGFR